MPVIPALTCYMPVILALRGRRKFQISMSWLHSKFKASARLYRKTKQRSSSQLPERAHQACTPVGCREQINNSVQYVCLSSMPQSLYLTNLSAGPVESVGLEVAIAIP